MTAMKVPAQVVAVSADQIDITGFADPPNSRWVLGECRVDLKLPTGTLHVTMPLPAPEIGAMYDLILQPRDPSEAK